MSERERQYESQSNSPEISKQQAEQLEKKSQERINEAAEQAKEYDKNDLEKIHERIEHAARSKKELEASQQVEHHAADTPVQGLGSHLKAHAYNRRKHSIQHQLKPADRAFSKVVHNPIVETISDAAENTVARPSGLLFAGLFAALSGIAVLYICKHYGYEYNFTISLAAMGLGFVAGILLEGAWKLVRR